MQPEDWLLKPTQLAIPAKQLTEPFNGKAFTREHVDAGDDRKLFVIGLLGLDGAKSLHGEGCVCSLKGKNL